MSKGISILLLVALFLAPQEAFGRITIQEIAWMGTLEGGANCEWIELFNDSSEDISFMGWTLTIENAEGSTVVLKLDQVGAARYGGIGANGFYLLARSTGSCSTLSPGTIADWLGSFGSGIVNDPRGATLTLRDHASSTVDVVDASAGWKQSGIGGDNTTKDTPQKTGDIWTTAAPTPRTWNPEPRVGELPEDPEESATSTPIVTIGGTGPAAAPPPYALPKLHVLTGPNRVVIAGAETPYRAYVYDEKGKLREGADISWSFGDGATKKGRSADHTYLVPGEYVIIARAKHGQATGIRPLTVRVVEAEVYVADIDGDGVRLKNDSDRMLDLSGWRIRAGEDDFTMPKDTAMLAGGDVVFPWTLMRLQPSDDVELLFPNGKSVVREEVEEEAEEVDIVPVPETLTPTVSAGSTMAPTVF